MEFPRLFIAMPPCWDAHSYTFRLLRECDSAGKRRVRHAGR
jgi:hypothetical protein